LQKKLTSISQLDASKYKHLYYSTIYHIIVYHNWIILLVVGTSRVNIIENVLQYTILNKMNPKVRIMHINDGIRYFDKLELKFKNI